MPLKQEERRDAIQLRVREIVQLLEHKEGSKMVDVKDMGTLVRCLGVNPSGAQIGSIVEQLNATAGEGEVLMPMQNIEEAVTQFMVRLSGCSIFCTLHCVLREVV